MQDKSSQQSLAVRACTQNKLGLQQAEKQVQLGKNQIPSKDDKN